MINSPARFQTCDSHAILIADPAAELVDTARLDALHRQVDQTTAVLNRLAALLSNDARSVTNDAAQQALSGSMSALEAEQLLRTWLTPPSDVAVERAAATRTTDANALDDAVNATRRIRHSDQRHQHAG